MQHKLLYIAVLLLGTSGARAGTFDFSYSGTFFGNTTNVTGTITATESLPGIYTITNVTGTRDSKAFTEPFGGNDSFIFDGSSAVGSLDFLLPTGIDTVTFAGALYTETGVTGTNIGTNFTITDPPDPTPVKAPEAATVSLLFTMGLGVWVLARKQLLK